MQFATEACIITKQVDGGLAQLVRAPASHAGGHWFESSSLHHALETLGVSRVFPISTEILSPPAFFEKMMNAGGVTYGKNQNEKTIRKFGFIRHGTEIEQLPRKQLLDKLELT